MSSSVRASMAASNAAAFVRRARQLESLKSDDAFCLLEMRHSGLFALFSNFNEPFLTRSPTSRLYSIPKLSYGELSEFFAHERHPEVDSVLIDLDEERESPLFAWNMLSSEDEALRAEMQDRFDARFVDIRKAIFAAETRQVAETIARGHALINWHRTHLFSPYSGAKTKKNVAGDHRKCPKTERFVYPLMAPVSIVLVVDDDRDRCILARQPKFSPHMYSCLAGFAEMGETVEATVRREVAEEVGVAVKSVEFVDSQHWPFPASSLMLGCLARVDPALTDLDPDGEELEDARWFSRAQVQAAFKRSLDPRLPTRRPGGTDDLPSPLSPSPDDDELLAKFYVPPPQAIAHQLIRRWLETP